MSEHEMQLIINNWTARRRQAFGIPESKDPVTDEEKLACQEWIKDYGLQTVVCAIWDIALKGRKHAGYHPRFKHIGAILQRDYRKLLDPERPLYTVPRDRLAEVEEARARAIGPAAQGGEFPQAETSRE